jgi:hypothetical protein
MQNIAGIGAAVNIVVKENGVNLAAFIEHHFPHPCSRFRAIVGTEHPDFTTENLLKSLVSGFHIIYH